MKHLAIDIGAESGRGVTGELKDGKLEIKEVARFENKPIQVGESLRWNLDQLKESVHKTVLSNLDCASVGIDTWAVDTVILDKDHNPLFQPFHYRDSRTNGIMEEVLNQIPRQKLYEQTGAQFLPFNTLYQWIALTRSENLNLDHAKSMVMIPDYLHMSLAKGDPFIEWTNATSTQFMNPTSKSWSHEILDQLNLPKNWLPEIAPTGKRLGTYHGVEVVLPASHDTASAILAVPDTEGNAAWISSGTWSIMGVEVEQAILSPESLASGFANEGGPENFRFSKNVAGLWIIQQCRSTWADQGIDLTYDDLRQLASEAKPTESFIDPDHPTFLAPGDMPERIKNYLKTTGQEWDLSSGQIVKMILESLAAKYRYNLDQLRTFASNRIDRINVVGGGSQHPLLSQLTADFCQVPVLTGPVEATAIGNILMQMKSLGTIGSIQEGRELVARSFEVKKYLPSQSDLIQSKYERFLTLLQS